MNTMHYHFLTHTGAIREKNEDAYFEPSSIDESLRAANGHLFAVADGMGGHRGGETAGKMAVQALKEFYDLQFQEEEHGNWLDWVKKRIMEMVNRINHYIYGARYIDDGYSQMGSTLAGILVKGVQGVIFHLGDSRVYHMSITQGFYQATKDHSKVQALIDQGLITSEGSRTHPDSHVITRSLGLGPKNGTNWPEVRIIDLNPGETLLLCTDGLTGLVDDGFLAETLLVSGRDLRTAAVILQDKALQCGGHDNVTLGIIQVKHTDDAGWDQFNAGDYECEDNR